VQEGPGIIETGGPIPEAIQQGIESSQQRFEVDRAEHGQGIGHRVPRRASAR
jgi:hypothetical protein